MPLEMSGEQVKIDRVLPEAESTDEAGGKDVHLVSLVLPTQDAGTAALSAVAEYVTVLQDLEARCELILVTPPGEPVQPPPQPEGGDVTVRVTESPSRTWGSAVAAGLASAQGDLLGLARLDRTPAGTLARVLGYGIAHPRIVVRANRRGRERLSQRLGSLLFNVECRLLLGLSTWDVNGTPKVFSRQHHPSLLGLVGDDLIDVRFALACEREGYPILEVPVREHSGSGAIGNTSPLLALRLYRGVLQLRGG